MRSRFVSKVGLGLLVSLGMACGMAWACSVPVFRYALERWPADAYEVILFHRGPLTSEHQALARDLDPEGGEGPSPANLEVRRVDLNADPAAEMVELKKQIPADLPLPAVRPWARTSPVIAPAALRKAARRECQIHVPCFSDWTKTAMESSVWKNSPRA